MAPVKTASYSDTQRMRLRGVILIAGEIVAVYWPMRTFVKRNPLHGLEDLPFAEAVQRGRELLGGRGYLSNKQYREYFQSGRIQPHHVDAAVRPLAKDVRVTLGTRELSHAEVLRTHLLRGIADPADETLEALSAHAPPVVKSLTEHLRPVLSLQATRERRRAALEAERAMLGRSCTLAVWCDRTLETQINDQINREMTKWCEGFLDEGHAPWAMPGRERGLYGAWKWLAAKEWSSCGIADSRKKIARLPDVPEDALLESLDSLGIPDDIWPEYLSRHLTALPGWAGFIKWRSAQPDYKWQEAYPANLVQYLAVRLYYERELVHKACQEQLGIEGNLDAVARLLLPDGDESGILGVVRDRAARGDGSRGTGSPERAAFRLKELADALQLAPAALLQTPPETLQVVNDWLDAFPESSHGPVWLVALEAGYQEQLLHKIRTNLANPVAESAVRPQAQAVFCIDVRAESFRRHLEAVGDYETYSFAGFFNAFIRYRALGGHHEVDQFPVVMQAKNEVREVARTYHARLFSRHRAGSRLLHAGHELLHDLKENVVTPYVAVETLGWFYGLPLIGRTLFTAWYQDWEDWVRSTFVPTVATAVTVDKMMPEEVQEMLTAEQRAVIRRALQERYGDRHLNLTLEGLEFLRKLALGEPVSEKEPPKDALSPEEEARFVQELRTQHQINPGGAFTRMERITRIGFTTSEQAFTVESALRMIGLVRNFARLVLFCGHGSTTANNPFEAALDCGACGGNPGKPNARVLAAMANKAAVRDSLAKSGIVIPQDTYFIAGLHDTTLDTVQFFDLEDVPHTHFKDLVRLTQDLEEVGRRNSRERCARFPEIAATLAPAQAARETRRRSGDWSEVRPEWGLAGNAAFIIGRRDLTAGAPLDGRVFLHSYDYREDTTGRILESVMTGPQVVGQWINMEYYFSTVDNEVYGSGTKIYHNVVGRFGVMSGPQSDLRTGLARQTVMQGPRPFHEPVRMLTLIEAPRERILRIIGRHRSLQRLYDNQWVHLTVLEPEEKAFYRYVPNHGWAPLADPVDP
jgi:uncharacterized protein YbcC (UPF0753/DUF2309 family)